jgi:hypothetical protein
VRLRPVALQSPQSDDDWMIEGVEDAGLQIKHIWQRSSFVLAYDDTPEFMTGVNRNSGGFKYGVLRLKVQLTLR